MKKTLILVILVVLTLVTGCAKTTTVTNEATTTKEEVKYQEKLVDPLFEKGLQISALESRNVSFTWWQFQGKIKDEPIWQLGQYCDLSTTRPGYDSTKNDLTLATLFEDGYGIESNEGNIEKLTNKSGSKEVIIDRSNHVIDLNVDTSKEYCDDQGNLVPRRNGEDWVHMILQQSAGGVVISDYNEINVEIDFTITDFEIFDSSIGDDQFQWIFSIKDKDSVINDYFWFNLTLFDALYKEYPGYEQYDGGKADATGKFIYAPKSSMLYEGEIEVGKEYSVKLNIRPLLEEAFNKAKAKGALAESEFTSMVLNTLNIGWEVSNISKVGVKISHLSLNVNE